MDLSKLPKMSQSPPPPSPAQPDPVAARPLQQPSVLDTPGSIGAEVWISLVIGVLCLLLGKNFATWGLTTLSGKPYHTTVNWVAGDKAGQEVSYWELQGYTALSDAAIFTYGIALILEGAML